MLVCMQPNVTMTREFLLVSAEDSHSKIEADTLLGRAALLPVLRCNRGDLRDRYMSMVRERMFEDPGLGPRQLHTAFAHSAKQDWLASGLVGLG